MSTLSWGPLSLLNYFSSVVEELINVHMPELMKNSDPIRQVSVNTNMVLLVSVQVRIENELIVSVEDYHKGFL